MRRRYAVLNLADRCARLAVFRRQAEAAGLCAVDRVDAVDTRTADALAKYRACVDPAAYARLEATVRRGYRTDHGELTRGAVGCALSHALAARRALKANVDVLVTFEDDADLPLDVGARIDRALHEAPPDWDVVLLGYWDRGKRRRPRAYLEAVDRFWGLHAYALSRPGMAKLLGATNPVRRQLDDALSNDPTLHLFGVAHDHPDKIRQRPDGSDVHFPFRRVPRNGDIATASRLETDNTIEVPA